MKKEIIVHDSVVEIEGRLWEKEGKRRMYFSQPSRGKNSGAACWDMVAKQWIKVHGEFGNSFKERIAIAFNL